MLAECKEDREKVDSLVQSVVNKILHAPVAVMKEESSEVSSKGIVDGSAAISVWMSIPSAIFANFVGKEW